MFILRRKKFGKFDKIKILPYYDSKIFSNDRLAVFSLLGCDTVRARKQIKI
jgi:hypothetical protein